jgi:hypothetical protein
MCIFIGVEAFVLATAVRLDGESYTSNTVGDIWDRGFGRFNFGSAVGFFDIFALIPTAPAVNSIQALLSFIMLIYNALFTSMLSGLEWNGYAKSRKPLRVASRRAGQRSSYYLQLPYWYVLPLMVTSGLLHWITSLSLFLVRF